MNLATLISATAAIVQFSIGLVFLVMARSPGWRRSWLLSIVCFSVACFSAFNIFFSLPDTRYLLAKILVANYFFAAVHCSAWLMYAFSPTERPWRGLSRRLRAIVGVTLALGLVALVPGVAITNKIATIAVPAFGVVYLQATTSWYGDMLGVWFLGVLLIPYVHFWRAARRGDRGARTRVIGFTIFFACCVEEVLVTSGVIKFLYLADVGFMAMVISSLVESIRQVMSNDVKLEELGRRLAEQVDSRTRERDQARDALVHADRLAAVGRLAAGVGHEINNPLQYVRANLDLVRDMVVTGRLEGDLVEIIDDARSGTDRIARVVADLRSFALPASEQRVAVELDKVVEGALKVAQLQIKHWAVIDRQLEGPLEPVHADEKRLGQVVLNLLLNAGQAIRKRQPQAPRIVVRGWMSGAHEASLAIIDNGGGIAAADLERLGEPYFSTRVDEGGTGLGLFVARGIVEALNGKMGFSSVEGEGTTVTVTLPTVARVVEVAAPAAAPVAEKRRRLLIIDDEPMIGRAVARMLRKHDCVVAPGGMEALALLRSDDRFDVVLCDIMMPDLSGAELWRQLSVELPEVARRMVFMTGGATLPEVAAFLDRPEVRSLMKPFERADLEALLKGLD